VGFCEARREFFGVRHLRSRVIAASPRFEKLPFADSQKTNASGLLPQK
jgi:hypothetical protein